MPFAKNKEVQTLAELRNVYVPEGLAQVGIDCTIQGEYKLSEDFAEQYFHKY
jgi:hypothetical protein